MRLFLTSSPCDDAGGQTVGLPFVYREDNGFARRLFQSAAGARRGVMLAAWPDEHDFNDRMAEDFAAALRVLGVPLTGFRMLDDRHDKACIREAVLDSQIVILSGGHVPTQNRWFHAIGLPEALARYEGTVMGISAGSMNCCGTVYAQPEIAGEAADPTYERFIPGLGLTDVMILPHYQNACDRMLDGMHLFRDISIPDSRGRVFYAIPDESYVFQDEEGGAVLCGEAWRIRDGVMEKITEYGQSVSLKEE